MATVIFGSSIVTIPLIIARLGWLVGGLILLFMQYFMSQVMATLVDVGKHEGCDSFSQLTFMVLGKKVGIMVSFFVIMANIGALTAHSIIIGDGIETLMTEQWGTDVAQAWRSSIVAGVFVAVVLPLALPRSLNALRSVAFATICVLVGLVVVVASEGADVMSIRGFGPNVSAVPTSLLDVVTALPVATYIFTAANAVFQVYYGIKGNTHQKFKKTTSTAFAGVCLLHLIVGQVGYLTHGSNTQGNVLISFGETTALTHSKAVPVLTALFTMSVMMVAPIAVFSARVVVQFIIYGPVTATPLQHKLQALVIIAIGAGIGLLARDVSIVFSIMGSVVSANQAFVIPALLYLRSKRYTNRTKGGIRIAKTMIVAGVCLAVCGLTGNVIRIMDKA